LCLALRKPKARKFDGLLLLRMGYPWYTHSQVPIDPSMAPPSKFANPITMTPKGCGSTNIRIHIV
jgi:hypothetical protein